jgi:AsmA-like C-terminal region
LRKLRDNLRKRIIWAIAALILIAAILAGISHITKPLLRERLVAFLHRDFESDVELSSFDVSVFPWVRVRAGGIVLRHHGRKDVPPLVEIEKLTMDASIFGLLRYPPRVRQVRLEGLKVRIPPRRKEKTEGPSAWRELAKVHIVATSVVSEDAELVILHSDRGKPPLPFVIHHAEVREFRVDRPSPFHATLTNPVPKGEIEADGELGPWESDEPSQTPASARYTFSHADLSTLHGLAGFLSSQGKFSGVLDTLEVEGETDAPDFSVRISGHALPLHTDFQAVVDGTSGNTTLKVVKARFRRTAVNASGRVVKGLDASGRDILLDATSENARVEDLLYLTVPSDPPAMTGQATFQTKVEIPPGEGDIADRLKLNGKFGIGSAKFSSAEVQGKVDTLSRKGQGAPKEDLGESVSKLRGSFALDNGVMTFSSLQFDVAGASVTLTGTYRLRGGELNFHGILRLQAKLSQTTTGIKSFFLKAVDPLFKGKGAGTVLPIQITGTREKPSFGLDSGNAAPPKKR